MALATTRCVRLRIIWRCNLDAPGPQFRDRTYSARRLRSRIGTPVFVGSALMINAPSPLIPSAIQIGTGRGLLARPKRFKLLTPRFVIKYQLSEFSDSSPWATCKD